MPHLLGGQQRPAVVAQVKLEGGAKHAAHPDASAIHFELAVVSDLSEQCEIASLVPVVAS